MSLISGASAVMSHTDLHIDEECRPARCHPSSPGSRRPAALGNGERIPIMLRRASQARARVIRGDTKGEIQMTDRRSRRGREWGREQRTRAKWVQTRTSSSPAAPQPIRESAPPSFFQRPSPSSFLLPVFCVCLWSTDFLSSPLTPFNFILIKSYLEQKIHRLGCLVASSLCSLGLLKYQRWLSILADHTETRHYQEQGRNRRAMSSTK